LNNLGIALASTNRIDEAIVTLFRAVELDPQNGPAERNLGHALYLAQRPDEALVHARRAVAIQPQDPGSQALLQALEALR
jgi:Flp pilus assembly protein TadD